MVSYFPSFFYFEENNPLIFTTAQFWVFFGFVLLVFQFINQKKELRNLFLLVCSLFFYYKSSGAFFALLLFTTALDFTLGKLIHKDRKKIHRQGYVAASILINVSLLAYFKYTYFLADLLSTYSGEKISVTNWLALWANSLAGSGFQIDKIILPVGISFYTFQSLSYIVDIYRREIQPVPNFLDYAFFVGFFPQLVAGPIVRAKDFIPQISKPYNLSEQEFNAAIFLIINGLIKKIAIADYISINFVDRVFQNPLSFSGFENLMAVYGYAIQIYCDFSGYTDMAIGLALLLGFRLNINFNSPYKAQSIADFWRRWHISLSTWLRDYLYIPLGGNKKGKARTYLNLLVTMLLGGLWHGASLRFVVWGGLHGAALAFHRMVSPMLKGKFFEHAIWKFFAALLTFHFVAWCWIYFRAGSFEIAQQVINQILFSWSNTVIAPFLQGFWKVMTLMLLGYAIHILPESFKIKYRNWFAWLPLPIKGVAIVVIIMLLYQVKNAEVQPFIYFQF